MFIYVFEDVLIDYTAGLVVIRAESLEQAQELARVEFGRWDSMDKFLANEDGFVTPAGCYPVPYDEARVLHYVYGGS